MHSISDKDNKYDNQYEHCLGGGRYCTSNHYSLIGRITG